MTTTRPLSDFEGEILNFNEGPALFFVCPVCLEANGGKRPGVHCHVVPFNPGGPGKDRPALVWANPSGSTVEDLTLAPRYLATSSACRVHVFVRGGKLQILGDSRPLP